MNLQELRDVQDQERSSDSLQPLPDDFYEEVSAYIRELKDERAAAAESAEDPFDVPAVSRLTDEIETAEAVATAIYERRMGKLLSQASLAAADVGGEVDGLTREERELFEDLVERIHENKQRVLDVLAGDGPVDAVADAEAGADAEAVSDPDGTGGGGASRAASAPDDPSVAAADAMGSGDDAEGGPAPGDADRPADGAETGAEPVDGGASGDDPAAEAAAVAGPGTDAAGVGDPSADPRDAPSDASPDAGTPPDEGDADLDDGTGEGLSGHTTVQITRDVGEVFGVDERVYSLAADDVVTLPTENAEALLERGAAERLEE
ncbi:MAG: hypothetical protein ABEJ42_08500 [Halobacteriaceae archaeon]